MSTDSSRTQRTVCMTDLLAGGMAGQTTATKTKKTLFVVCTENVGGLYERFVA